MIFARNGKELQIKNEVITKCGENSSLITAENAYSKEEFSTFLTAILQDEYTKLLESEDRTLVGLFKLMKIAKNVQDTSLFTLTDKTEDITFTEDGTVIGFFKD
jgi:hypothetical protein